MWDISSLPNDKDNFEKNIFLYAAKNDYVFCFLKTVCMVGTGFSIERNIASKYSHDLPIPVK